MESTYAKYARSTVIAFTNALLSLNVNYNEVICNSQNKQGQLEFNFTRSCKI